MSSDEVVPKTGRSPLPGKDWFRLAVGGFFLYAGTGGLIGGGSPGLITTLDSPWAQRVLGGAVLASGLLLLAALAADRHGQRLAQRVTGISGVAGIAAELGEFSACAIGGLACTIIGITTTVHYAVARSDPTIVQVLFNAAYPAGAELVVALLCALRVIHFHRKPA